MDKKIKVPGMNVCCICGKPFQGFGNNPVPVRKCGVCCTDCNYELVIPARINNIYKDNTPKRK